MGHIAKTIEITADEVHGDAPLWVRRSWKGCRFPTASLECGHVPQYVMSVLPATRQGLMSAEEFLARSPDEKIAGYDVHTDVALQVLECHAPQAADWFYALGYPKDGCGFRFKREEVSVVETYTEEELHKFGPLTFYDDMETGTMRPML